MWMPLFTDQFRWFNFSFTFVDLGAREKILEKLETVEDGQFSDIDEKVTHKASILMKI